jgi:hypothetical protein
VLQIQGINQFAGLFCNSFLCPSIKLLRHCVVVEAECNWYLLDINIYSLLKNEKLATHMLWLESKSVFRTGPLHSTPQRL